MEFHTTGAEIVEHRYQVAQTPAQPSSFQTINVSPCSSFLKQRSRAGRFAVAPDIPSSLNTIWHLAFFNAAGLFVIFGAEFLAMMLVVVYVGAVAVLFLFVVMMLDIDFAALGQQMRRYVIAGAVVGLLLLAELVLTALGWASAAALSMASVRPGNLSYEASRALAR